MHSSKGRTLTRRLNELRNMVRSNGAPIDVEEKVIQIKDTFKDFGPTQDELLSHIDENNVDNITNCMWWYDKYDREFNAEISEATKATTEYPINSMIKLQKLKIPVFDSQLRKYLKWKGIFERYIRHLSEEIKYDYLLARSNGRANEYVTNTASYNEAITKLDKEFGNKNLIMNLLLDDMSSSIVRRGDLRRFEKLSYETNVFRDRLLEMGRSSEAENTYVLREIETKLNPEDTHKWLESMGNAVDIRRVGDIVK